MWVKHIVFVYSSWDGYWMRYGLSLSVCRCEWLRVCVWMILCEQAFSFDLSLVFLISKWSNPFEPNQTEPNQTKLNKRQVKNWKKTTKSREKNEYTDCRTCINYCYCGERLCSCNIKVPIHNLFRLLCSSTHFSSLKWCPMWKYSWVCLCVCAFMSVMIIIFSEI